MGELQQSRYKIKGADCLILRFSGVMDADTLAQIAEDIRVSVDLNFDGYVILDVRNLNDLLENNDVSLLLEQLSSTRYFFRKPTAVLTDRSNAINHSRPHFQASAERIGMMFRDFEDLDDAVNWLKNPDS